MPKTPVKFEKPSCSGLHIRKPDDLTQGKRLDLIQPIPVVKKIVDSTTRRGRALAEVLTSPDHIATKKSRMTKTYNI